MKYIRFKLENQAHFIVFSDQFSHDQSYNYLSSFLHGTKEIIDAGFCCTSENNTLKTYGKSISLSTTANEEPIDRTFIDLLVNKYDFAFACNKKLAEILGEGSFCLDLASTHKDAKIDYDDGIYKVSNNSGEKIATFV